MQIGSVNIRMVIGRNKIDGGILIEKINCHLELSGQVKVIIFSTINDLRIGLLR